MSAPIKNEENPQDPLSYAPPWARAQAAGRQPRPPNSLSSAAKIGDSKINWPPPPWKRAARFEGDVAMTELRQKLSLDPHVFPEPPARMQRRPIARSSLAKISLCIGLAAIVTYAVEFNLSYVDRSIAPNSDTSIAKTARLIGTPGETQSMAATRLVVEDRQAFTDEPMPSGVVLAGAIGGQSVFLNGLVKGAGRSAGEPFGSTGWRVPARELGRVLAYAPNSFVGQPMDTEIEFRSGTNAHLNTQLGRLEWIMKSLELRSMSEKQFDQGDTVEPESATAAPASAQLSRLVKRGLEFLKDGDIAASRLVLRRAAEAGNAQAALLLGGTFDPIVLGELGVFGLTGDPATARAWYQKAVEFGSIEASRQIERLAKTGK
jgi:hypothetical protein